MIWLLTLLPLASCLMDRGLPPLPGVTSRNGVEHWLNVRLDHFDASNTDTFPMRFFYNPQYSQSPHVVIFVGGEWSASPSWTEAGLAAEVAAAAGAGMFYTEHRYYGLTRPTENTEVSGLRYLTVDQALGDLAQFIQYIKSDDFENGYFKEGKVVLVGCSYAGSMATWMKLAYPHLIAAAFSDSGPLHAQEDFPEYVEIINEAIREQGGAACLASVEESIQQLAALLETPAGPASVSQMFNTCTTISATTPLDVATFFWFGIQETFAYLVQYATPGNIPDACEVLTNGHENPVQRLANWITSQAWNQPCIETRYTEVVAAHTNTSYDAPDAVMRLWTYQTCVEYGWYQTTNGAEHPFLSTVPLEYFHQMCRDFFGNSFDEAFLRRGIERTNLFFAGWEHLPDHVISVVGSHDPWSPMGPHKQHETPLAPVHVLDGISHCRAIMPLASSETEQVREVKMIIQNDLYKSLTGQPLMISSGSIILPGFTLLFAVVMLLI